jgi:hypothetical protein
MLADAHRQAAEDDEKALADLGDPAVKPYIGRAVIELCWGAAFHWIAYACQQKHGKHKEHHSGLVAYLRQLGEPDAADRWETLERARNTGWYGHGKTLADVQNAERLWREIRTWALT